MTPLWLRFFVVGAGAAVFFGSWLVGNTVDAGGAPGGASRYVMLQKDAITFFMRIAGAFIVVIGLLLWVAAGKPHSLF